MDKLLQQGNVKTPSLKTGKYAHYAQTTITQIMSLWLEIFPILCVNFFKFIVDTTVGQWTDGLLVDRSVC